MPYISMVTLAVSDLEAATKFYEAMSWEKSPTSVDGNVAFLQGGTVVLGLYPTPSFVEEVGREVTPGHGGVSLTTNVSSDEVVDAVLAAAVRAGGEVIRPAAKMHWGGCSGYFADLDGHVWEVSHNPFVELDQDGRMILDPGEGFQTPQEAKAFLEDFRERTDAAGGPLVGELADAALAIVDEAAAKLAAALKGMGTDKIIATMTELTERSMLLGDGSERQMRLSAASTLVSGRISG